MHRTLCRRKRSQYHLDVVSSPEHVDLSEMKVDDLIQVDALSTAMLLILEGRNVGILAVPTGAPLVADYPLSAQYNALLQSLLALGK